jgi:hypothetical protein
MLPTGQVVRPQVVNDLHFQMVINAYNDKASTRSRAGGPAPERTDCPDLGPDLCDSIAKQLAMPVISLAHTL